MTMRTWLGLKTLFPILLALVLLGIGFAGQSAKATGGDGDGDSDGSASRSAESSAPPPGFLGLQMALASFHRNAIFMSPDQATAKLLIDLTFAPLIDLLTALQFQQLYGVPKGSRHSAKNSSRWLIDEEIKLSLRYAPRCGDKASSAGSKQPSAPPTSWDSSQAAGAANKACSDDFLTKTSNLFGPSFGKFVAKFGSGEVKKRKVVPNLIYIQGTRPEDLQSPGEE